MQILHKNIKSQFLFSKNEKIFSVNSLKKMLEKTKFSGKYQVK